MACSRPVYCTAGLAAARTSLAQRLANRGAVTAYFLRIAFGRTPYIVNRSGFPGGHLVWVRRLRLEPRPGHNSALPPRREGMWPIVSSSLRLLSRSTHSRVAYSTASSDCHEPRRWMTSALNSPMIVSARALSYESPTLPTEGSMPASRGARCSECSRITIHVRNGRRGRCRRRDGARAGPGLGHQAGHPPVLSATGASRRSRGRRRGSRRPHRQSRPRSPRR